MTQAKTENKKVHTAMELDIFHSLEGKSFCLTGEMSLTRAQMEYIISALGGEPHKAIKKSTTALVVPNGDGFRQGSKYNAAVRAGIMVLNEQEFIAMILPSVNELRGINGEGSTR